MERGGKIFPIPWLYKVMMTQKLGPEFEVSHPSVDSDGEEDNTGMYNSLYVISGYV